MDGVKAIASMQGRLVCFPADKRGRAQAHHPSRLRAAPGERLRGTTTVAHDLAAAWDLAFAI